MSSSAYAAGDGGRFDFEIECAELSDAMDQLVQQAGVQILYPYDLAHSAQVNPVSGYFSVQEILTLMFEGTGLSAGLTEDGVVTISKSHHMNREGKMGVAQESHKKSLLARVSAFVLAGVVASGANAQTESESDDSRDVIIVSAQKRDQGIEEVPTSITLVNTEAALLSGLDGITDWAQLVPGLSFFDRGTPGFTQITLRGVTSGSQQTSPTVGFYVNDAPFSFSIPFGGASSLLVPDLDPFDIERIEVLRGPQGTLYGASNLGGLIKYVTKKPDPNEFEGRYSLGASDINGGGTGYTLRAAVNIPIITDKLALRASAFKRETGGFIDNTSTGSEDVNVFDSEGVRLALGYSVTDNVNIQINGIFQNNVLAGQSSIDASLTTTLPSAGDYEQTRFVDEEWGTEYREIDGTITWDIGDYQILSSTSFAEIEGSLTFDFTGLLGALSPFGTGPQGNTYQKFTEELRMTSPEGGLVEWLGGVFYTKEDVTTFSRVEIFDSPGVPGAIPVVLNSGSEGDYEEIAVFGNATVNLTETLDVTGGLRWARNEVNTASGRGGLLGGGGPLDFTLGPVDSSSESVLTYLAAANWKFAPSNSVYFRFATGYRPGGPITPPPTGIPDGFPQQYDSDDVLNYELGAKTSFMDGRVRANIAAFYIDWNDIQLPFIVDGFRVLTNGGGALSKGLELELDIAATDELDIIFRGAYIDSELTEDAPLLGAVDGDQLPYVADLSLSSTVSYERPISQNLTGRAAFDWAYTSDRLTDFASAGPSQTLEGFHTVTLRGGIGFETVSIDIFARNLLDEYAYSSGQNFGADFRAVPIAPRTIGVQVTGSF